MSERQCCICYLTTSVAWSRPDALIWNKRHTGCIYNAWKNFRNKSPTPEQGKNLISMYVHEQFQRYSPTTLRPHSFRFLIAETFENSSAFSSDWIRYTTNNFYLCQAIHNRPRTFEKMQQSMIRCVHVCSDSRAGHFDNLLWIGNWWTIRILLTLTKLGMCIENILHQL